MSDTPIDPAQPADAPPAPGSAPLGDTGDGPAPGVGLGGSGPEARDAGTLPRDAGADSAPAGDSPGPASELAASSPSPEPPPVQGGVRPGKVTRVTSEEVFLQLDDGANGVVPMIEFAGQPIPTLGDQFSVIVERPDPNRGLMLLSKRQAEEHSFWQAVQPGDTLEGVVTGMNKGGLDVDLGGARAFLPSSQVDVRRLRDISTLIGEHIRCVVSQVDRTTRDLVVSRKKFIEQEHKRQRQALIGELEEGQRRTGKVSNVTDYGAFVDLGGVDGLLHMTDMSWAHVKHPKDVVQEGQEIEVCILKVDRAASKVSLGLKQITPDPWDGIERRYPEGKRIKGRVARMADFGAFLELEEGVDALLPLGEMSWTRRPGHPSAVVKVGDEPEVIVLKVDAAKRRISVGLKQAEDNPWETAVAALPVNAKVPGKVSKVMDFGAFVELESGLEGLIHISELSDRRVRAVEDVVQAGQEVEVRVLKVDSEAQRISLSMKPEPKLSAAALGTDGRPDKAGKKKKRPVRGGLSSHFEW